jgi:hypothetical protein
MHFKKVQKDRVSTTTNPQREKNPLHLLELFNNTLSFEAAGVSEAIGEDCIVVGQFLAKIQSEGLTLAIVSE